jgi:hypothetical protein
VRGFIVFTMINFDESPVRFSCLIFTAIAVATSIASTAASAQAPPNAATRERNYLSAMKADLKMLANAEEAYFMDHNGYYAGTVSASQPLVGFSPSPNVTITVATAGTAEWTATAKHSLTPTKCTYHLGATLDMVCDPPLPSDTSFATPRGSGTVANDNSGPRFTTIGGADSLKIRPGKSRSFQFDVWPTRPRCTVTGQVVGLSGGDKRVVVLVMTEFSYQDWVNNRPARTYFESSPRTEIPFDVRIEGEGMYRLVVWNQPPGSDSKVVQLQHTQVGCTE